jgi:hypothetical protein
MALYCQRPANRWRRRKEVFEKKTDVLLEILERSWDYGIRRLGTL